MYLSQSTIGGMGCAGEKWSAFVTVFTFIHSFCHMLFYLSLCLYAYLGFLCLVLPYCWVSSPQLMCSRTSGLFIKSIIRKNVFSSASSLFEEWHICYLNYLNYLFSAQNQKHIEICFACVTDGESLRWILHGINSLLINLNIMGAKQSLHFFIDTNLNGHGNCTANTRHFQAKCGGTAVLFF